MTRVDLLNHTLEQLRS